jgi:hypothetical protein
MVMTTTRFRNGLAVAAAALLSAGTVLAALTPERKCLQHRYNAAANSAACQERALGKFFGNGDYAKFDQANRTCTVRYAANWPKLQAIGVAPCSGARFEDNGDGTVTDKLTGLQWERKSDDATVHDKDNVYTWNAGFLPFTAADGPAFTSFLKALNVAPGCFAGQCDWRLPTVTEFQAIRALSDSKPYACGGPPCIDEIIFGPAMPNFHWSSTTVPGVSYPFSAWGVDFGDGGVVAGFSKNGNSFVRGVRGGL